MGLYILRCVVNSWHSTSSIGAHENDWKLIFLCNYFDFSFSKTQTSDWIWFDFGRLETRWWPPTAFEFWRSDGKSFFFFSQKKKKRNMCDHLKSLISLDIFRLELIIVYPGDAVACLVCQSRNQKHKNKKKKKKFQNKNCALYRWWWWPFDKSQVSNAAHTQISEEN